MRADSSVANSASRIDGEKIEIKLGVVIRVECGDDPQIDEFIPFFNPAESFSVVEDGLLVHPTKDSGMTKITPGDSLIFRRKADRLY